MMTHSVSRLATYLGLILSIAVINLSALAKDHQVEGKLTADLSAPFETASQVVAEIAADGVIRGSGQYTTESQITGALPAQSSTLLKPTEVPSGAQVFYKIREGAIAPRHYNDSNDQGTIVVAYIVEKISDKQSRVTIESVFVPDSRHGRSTSDGSVETCEFTAIETRLKTLAAAQEDAKQQKEKEQQEARVRELRRELAEEQARFDALNAEAQQLEKRQAELRKLSVVRIKSASARLKASPYVRSETVQSLSDGEELEVLYRTASWYRVRTADDHVGWIYYSFLEPAQ